MPVDKIYSHLNCELLYYTDRQSVQLAKIRNIISRKNAELLVKRKWICQRRNLPGHYRYIQVPLVGTGNVQVKGKGGYKKTKKHKTVYSGSRYPNKKVQR